MPQEAFAFDLDRDADLLAQVATEKSVETLRKQADARRDAFFAAAEGHSPAWIAEKALHMAVIALTGILGGHSMEEGHTGEGPITADSHEGALAALGERIGRGLSAVQDMAFDAHKAMRPDEHEPDCEFRNPEGN